MSNEFYMHEWDSEYQLPFCEIYSQSNMIECEIIMEKRKTFKSIFSSNTTWGNNAPISKIMSLDRLSAAYFQGCKA